MEIRPRGGRVAYKLGHGSNVLCGPVCGYRYIFRQRRGGRSFLDACQKGIGSIPSTCCWYTTPIQLEDDRSRHAISSISFQFFFPPSLHRDIIPTTILLDLSRFLNFEFLKWLIYVYLDGKFNLIRKNYFLDFSKMEMKETWGFVRERLAQLKRDFFFFYSSYTLAENRVNCSPRAIKYTVVKFLTCMHKIALIRNSKKLDIPIACVKLPVGRSSPPPLPPVSLCFSEISDYSLDIWIIWISSKRSKYF